MAQDTLSRSLHDVGLAAWFGGTLANAVALNAAAAEAGLSSRTGAVANVGLSPVEVPLDGRYRDLDGVLCRTAVVPPRSAAVYVAVPDVIPSPRHVGSA